MVTVQRGNTGDCGCEIYECCRFCCVDPAHEHNPSRIRAAAAAATLPAANTFDLVAEFDRIVAGDCIVDDVPRHQEVVAAIRRHLQTAPSSSSDVPTQKDEPFWSAETLYGWKRLSDGAIVQDAARSKDDLFESAGFGAVDVDLPIKGMLAVEVAIVEKRDPTVDVKERAKALLETWKSTTWSGMNMRSEDFENLLELVAGELWLLGRIGVFEGPSSTDFEERVGSRADLQARLADKSFSRGDGYEIWRNAWIAARRRFKESVAIAVQGNSAGVIEEVKETPDAEEE